MLSWCGGTGFISKNICLPSWCFSLVVLWLFSSHFSASSSKNLLLHVALRSEHCPSRSQSWLWGVSGLPGRMQSKKTRTIVHLYLLMLHSMGNRFQKKRRRAKGQTKGDYSTDYAAFQLSSVAVIQMTPMLRLFNGSPRLVFLLYTTRTASLPPLCHMPMSSNITFVPGGWLLAKSPVRSIDVFDSIFQVFAMKPIDCLKSSTVTKS